MVMNDDTTFEQALAQLEDAVARLEQGKVPLDEALDCFERGVESANLCRKKLKAVEARIEVLVKSSAGEYSTDNFPGQG